LGSLVPPNVVAKLGLFVTALALAVGSLSGAAVPAEIGGSPGRAAPSRAARERAAPLVLFVDHRAIETRSTATTVAQALNELKVSIGPHDIVTPESRAPLPADRIVRVQRVKTWIQRICSRLSPSVVTRDSSSLARNTSRIVSAGHDGLRETLLNFVSIDGRLAKGRVIATRTLTESRPRIIARGTATPTEMISQHINAFLRNTLSRTDRFAHAALAMIATAYTPFCSTCSGTGRGATGMLVHHGVVAVDPHVIPLGSQLFIPGYGRAVAGDTGGAIIGRRIDLAFNSYGDAMRFGRRSVTVYVLP
jgi:3D (Asp-Asp-Asp) domain-containing protein